MTNDEVSRLADALQFMTGPTRHAALIPAAAALRQLQAENEALRKLAEHLRSCRDCGEWDVKDCSEGRPLWDAAMKP
jgi:hypothetical protein